MRVLVTRASEDAERTAQKLAALGHEAVLAPVIRIVPTGEPAPAAPYDALIVTSIHAVEALSSLPDRSRRVFAVGTRTAEAVRAVGFASVEEGEGEARSLAALIRSRLSSGLTLLHVTARHHKEEPAASLQAAGFTVQSWEAYEAKAVADLSEPALSAMRSGEIGAALHYSRRSAEIFIALAEKAGLASSLTAFPHVCLSADVAAPLETRGIPTRVADKPSEERLIATLP